MTLKIVFPLLLFLLAGCVAVVLQLRSRNNYTDKELATIIFDTALDAVVIMNSEGVIEGWNRQAENIFGWSRQEALGHRMAEKIIPPRYRYDHARALKRFLDTGQARILNRRVELSALHRDGHEFPIELAIAATNSDKAWTFSAFVRDISDRKRAEEALMHSEEHVRLLLNSTAEGIYGIDVDGRCTFCNPACVRLLGYQSPNDLLGRDMHLMIHHSYADRSPYPLEACHLCRAFRQGEGTHIGDEVFWRADGTSFAADYFSYPVRQGNELVGAVVTFLDVTESKHAQEQLMKAKESAEAANRAKSEFLGNMSHEMRTPLNCVIGMTQLVLEDELTPEHRECLNLVLSAGNSLLHVITSILEFAEIDARKIQLQRVPFDVSNCVAKTIQALTPQRINRHVAVSYEVSADVPQTVVGDPDRLRKILTNLVSNGINFSEGDEVRVRVEAERIATGIAVVLHFAVSDTGVGIPADRQEIIFQPFTQADNSLQRRFGGIGLGLAIVQQLAEMMSGRVWLESEVGKGTTFYFTAQFDLNNEETGCSIERNQWGGFRESKPQ